MRILGAETTGANDLFWYVKADSPIKTLKDTDGKTLGFSGKGSSTDGIVTAFMKQYSSTPSRPRPAAPPQNLTAVMSGQIDVGWSAPPFGLDQLDRKEIRIIATGNDAAVFKGQTVRLLAVNAQTLQSRKAVFERYMKAYRETIDYVYSDPAALETLFRVADIPRSQGQAHARRLLPEEAINPDRSSVLIRS